MTNNWAWYRAAVAMSGIMRHDVEMRGRTLVFAFFAAAMLFSVVREWSAPISCPRLEVTSKHFRHH